MDVYRNQVRKTKMHQYNIHLFVYDGGDQGNTDKATYTHCGIECKYGVYYTLQGEHIHLSQRRMVQGLYTRNLPQFSPGFFDDAIGEFESAGTLYDAPQYIRCPSI
jgi:hypothetical protein